jgi:uncharacterized membrane protein
MKAWWRLSVALVALMLAVLILAAAMPLALRAGLAAVLALWTTALVYFVARRW